MSSARKNICDVLLFCKMAVRWGWAVVVSEALIRKDAFWVCHDRPFRQVGRVGRGQQEVVVSGWPVSKAARVRLQLSCCVRVLGVFRVDVDG